MSVITIKTKIIRYYKHVKLDHFFVAQSGTGAELSSHSS